MKVETLGTKLELHKNSNGPSSFSVWSDGELLGNLKHEVPRNSPDDAIHAGSRRPGFVFMSLDGNKVMGFSRNETLDNVLTHIRKEMTGR